MADPQSPAPLEYAAPGSAPLAERLRTVTTVLLASAFVCVVAAWVLEIFIRTNTIVFTGPLLFLLSIALLVCGLLGRRTESIAAASLHLVLCVLLLALLFGLDWSPARIKSIFPFLGLGYLTMALPLNVLAFVRLGTDGPAPQSAR